MSEEDNITKTPEYQELRRLLVGFFGDELKFEAWMLTNNHMLGGLAPIDMLFLGRYEKLLKFVKDAIEEHDLWKRRN